MILVRKISHQKWKPSPAFPPEEIRADAITADLRTTDDALSFWECETESHLAGPALAIAAAMDRVDRIDLAWLPQEILTGHGLTHAHTAGNTPARDWVSRHISIDKLDYVRLGTVAHQINAAIKQQRFRRFSKQEVAELLIAATRDNLVESSKLHEKVRKEISAAL